MAPEKKSSSKKSSTKKTAKKRVPVKKVTVKKKTSAKKKKDPAPEHHIHDASEVPLVMYRRIALTFVVVVAFALIAVLYLATMQAVIRVSAVETTLTSEYIVTAAESPTSDIQVPSVILEGTLGKTMAFEPSGEGAVEEDAIATGTVTIYNGLSFAQPLVRTTRLLSPEGVLFRLDEAVSIPAGGSVTAAVYADVAGATGNIEPTRFSVPGLSTARQELVYAESSEAFSGGVVTRSVVSEEEMEEAASQLEQGLFDDARTMLREEAGEDYTGELYALEVAEKTFSIEPNTQADGYEISMTVNVSAVFYDEAKMQQIVVAKLYESLGQGQEFVSIDTENLEVSIEALDQEGNRGSLKTVLVGRSITSRANDALDVSRFVGMSGEEVEQVLVQEGVATEVKVDFFPFWVRSVPQLKDHIYIEIE